MTITTFRFYYYAKTEARAGYLTGTHWGFATWFKRRLKPIREQLRGQEAKGVDIVNVGLYEIAEHAWHPNEWRQRANTFNFSYVCNLRPLEDAPAIENIQKLMLFAAFLVEAAPWPQVRALSTPLATPLSEEDVSSLEPHLQWPRPPGIPLY
jgi:hypothetical protein